MGQNKTQIESFKIIVYLKEKDSSMPDWQAILDNLKTDTGVTFHNAIMKF